MNIINKARTFVSTVREMEVFKKVLGASTLPPDLVPAIDLTNYIDQSLTLVSGNQPNKTGIQGYLPQEAVDQIFTKTGAGGLKLQAIYNNSATDTVTSTALKAIISAGGSSYVTAPVVTAVLQGPDVGVATAPTYTAVISGGSVISLTQTGAGANMTQIPLLSFNNTGTGGSGAAGYVVLSNNWLDDKFINPNGGALTKLISDLANNYPTTSQVNALLSNQLQVPDWFEDFGGFFSGSAVTRSPSLSATIGNSFPISDKGWSVYNSGSNSTTHYYTDFYRDNSANTVAGDLPPGVFTFVGAIATIGNIASILANPNQAINANYIRDIRFRMRLATPGGSFATSSTIYFGLTAADYSVTPSSLLTNAAYFQFNPSCTASNDSALLNSGAIITNFGSLNSQTVTSGTTGYPANPRNFNTYRITYDGTQFVFYINNIQILNASPLSSTAKVYPFIAATGTGGSFGAVPIAIDYIDNKVTLPSTRI